MKKFTKIFGWIALSVGVAASTIYFSVVIYRTLWKNDSQKRNANEQDYGIKPSKSTTLIKDEFGFTMQEKYNKIENVFGMSEDGSYLGEFGMNKLHERVKKDLGYGPEIIGLKSITISDGYYIDDDANGVFYPPTKEIFLNSKNLKKIVPIYAPWQLKVELAFQIIFHEYGHFLVSAYLTNNKPNEPYIAEIYSDVREKRKKQNWNKNFVKNFKKHLKYDRKTPLYKDGYKYNEYQNSIWNPISVLGSKYCAQEMFDISNGKEKPSYPKIYNMNISYTNKFELGQMVQIDNLHYYYSMDELFARKYQLLEMIVQPIKCSKNWRNYEMKETGEFFMNGSNIPSPYLNDVFKIQSGMKNINISGLPSPAKNFRTMADSPFEINQDGSPNLKSKNAKNMYESMIKEMGQKDGFDIACMFSENKSVITSKNEYKTPWNSFYEKSKIKFGGYLKENEKYDFIGYYEKDKNGKPKFKEIKISIYPFTYHYKDSFLSKTKKESEFPEKWFYVTDNYIDGKELNNKKLYFGSKDEEGYIKEVVPMGDVRSGDLGKVSNFFPAAPKNLQTSYFEATHDKDGTKIKMSDWSETWN